MLLASVVNITKQRAYDAVMKHYKKKKHGNFIKIVKESVGFEPKSHVNPG